MIPKINSAHGSSTRNIINRAIDSINVQGKSIQDLVAEGQLTEAQYSNLIITINGMIKSGDVDKLDLTPELRSEVDKVKNKIDKGEVSVYDINKNKGKFDQTYMSDEFLQQMAGNTPVNSVPADLGVTTFKLAHKSVTTEKLDFVKSSTNLLNKNRFTSSVIINTATGELVSGGHYVSDYTPVDGNTAYIGNLIGRVAFYDANKNFIHPTTTDSSFMTPDDARYVRVTVLNANFNTAQLNKGSSLLPFEEWFPPSIDSTKISPIEEESIENKHLSNSTISIDKLDFMYSNEPINWFNKNDIQTGGYYDSSTYEWKNKANIAMSNYIPVKEGDVVRISGTVTGAHCVFKNPYGDIISGLYLIGGQPKVLVVPENAVELSVSFNTSESDTLMIVKNMELPSEYVEYEEYKLLFDASAKKAITSTVEELGNRWFGKTANFLGDSITWGYIPNDGRQMLKPYPSLVGETLNLGTVRNYGINSSTVSGSGASSFNVRFTEMDDNADLVCVFGGTNDWNGNRAIGTVSDTTNSTFYGALNILMDGLITKYPTADIVFFTPLHRQGDTGNLGMVNYRNAVIECGEKFGIPVLDLYASSGFYPDNTVSYNTFVPDGRHPNEAGHRKLAHRITGFLKTL